MTDATAEEVEEPKKSSKMPMILGLVAALVGGGGGFFATYSGMILAPEVEEVDQGDIPAAEPLPDVRFVAIEPLTISLGSGSSVRYLKFQASLEVPPEYEADVVNLMPRILDILNGYLRALRIEDFERPDALLRLRNQMLRRVQIVAGRGRVNDLLVMEFVLN